MSELTNNLPNPDFDLQQRIVQDSVDMNPIDTSVPYQSIDDILPELNNPIDDQYMKQIDMYRTEMDKVGPNAIGNMFMDKLTPGLSTSTEPQRNLSIAEQLQQKLKEPLVSDAGTLPNPIWSNVRQINFDRQYNSDAFADIGFAPYADMDAVFNKNMTGYDGFQRGFKQFGNLFYTGFASSYRSIADIFDGDSYWEDPDLTSAQEMEDAMRIGGSTDGSLGGWFGNLGLNFGYTAGIVASIAAEEAILATGAALAAIPTGGGSLAAFIAAQARFIPRIKKAVDFTVRGTTFGRGAKASYDFVKQISQVERARDLFNAAQLGRGMNTVFRTIAPETLYAIKNWKTAKNTAQNTINLAKISNMFGAFYRDFRMVNASLSESKMEAGMVYNQVLNNGLAEANYKNQGGGVTEQQTKDIMIKAAEASFKAQMANFAVIYASNRIVLKNAFGGWRRQVTNSNRILRKDAFTAVKGSKYLIKRIPQELKLAFNRAGYKGAAKVMGTQMLRYGAANLAEGAQEISQEAISAATVGYYSSLLRDPLSGGPSTLAGYVGQSTSNLASKEGLSVFLSGFLMGGLAGPYQQVLFQGLPAIGRSAYAKANTKFGDGTQSNYAKEYSQRREQVLDDIVKQINERGEMMKQDLESVLSPSQFQAILQKQNFSEQSIAFADNDKYDFDNAQFAAQFFNLYSAYERGSIKFARESYVEFSKMSDKDLAEAFNPKEFGKPEKVRKRIQKQINLIDEYGETFANKLPKVFDKTFNYENLTAGSPEYLNLQREEQAYKHNKMLYMFTNEAYKNAVERQAAIETSLETEPLFAKQASSDIRILYNKESIDQELTLLDAEIKAAEEAGESKTVINKKKNKRKALQKYADVINDPKNITKKGNISRRQGTVNKVRSAFKNYIQVLAENNSDFVNQDLVDDAVAKIVDHSALRSDAASFSRSIDFMTNPTKQQEIADRSKQYYEWLYKNRDAVVKEAAARYLDTQKKNELINLLYEKDVAIEPTLVRKYFAGEITEKDLLALLLQGNKGAFFIDGKLLNDRLEQDAKLIKEVASVLAGFVQLDQQIKAQEEKESPQAVQAETILDVEDKLEDAGIQINIGDINTSKTLKSILEKEYRKYRANTKDNILTPEQWRKTTNATNIVAALSALKRIWATGYDTIVVQNGQETAVKVKPTQQEIESEIGFQKFLDSREAIENPLVQSIVNDYGLNMGIFSRSNTGQAAVQPISGMDGVAFKGVRRSSAQGEFVEIVDANGNSLSNEMLEIINRPLGATFSSMEEAKVAFDTLEREYSDGTTFRFDGMSLSKGISVFSKVAIDDHPVGTEFIINSNPKHASRGTVSLVPADRWTNNFNARKDAAIYESELDFSKRFETEQISFTVLSADAPKVSTQDPVVIYSPRALDRETGEKQLALIGASLTEDQLLNGVIINILPNDKSYEDPFIINGISNPYIRRKNERVTLQVAIADPVLRNDLNQKLTDANLPTIPENGEIGYIPAESIIFKDDKGNQILPSQMTPEFASNVFVPQKGKTIEQTLEEAKINFAKQDLLLNTVETLIGEEQNVIKIGQLPEGFQIRNFSGYPDYDGSNPLIPLSELPYAANDRGDVLIFDITRAADGSMIDYETYSNITDPDQKAALVAEVEEGLNLPIGGQSISLFDKMMGPDTFNYTERYQYVVRQPNGTYTLATAKTTGLSKDVLEGVMLDMKTQAEKTRQENLVTSKNISKYPGKKVGDYINADYNTVFNNDTNKKFRVNMPKGFNLNITVDPWGKIRGEIYQNGVGRVGKYQYLYEADLNKEGSNISKLEQLLAKLTEQSAAKDINVTINNFTTSVPLNASVNEMLDSLSTKLSPQIRRGGYFYLNADSAMVQAAIDKAANVNRPDNVEPKKSISQGQKAKIDNQEADILSRLAEDQVDARDEVAAEADRARAGEVSDVVWEGFINDPTTVQKQLIDSIAQKLIAGVPLTEREQAIRQERSIAPQIEEYLKGQMAEEQKKSIDLTALAATPIDVINSKIKELEEQIVAEVGWKNKRKALKENKEYQSLLQERERLLKPGNKVLPAGYSVSDLESLEDFLLWAQDNLPEFITVADIKQLGNNLKAGGKRVGAFVLDLNGLAGGLTTGGTIYTGATNPFRYHEAFHGVYRMLLSPEEQKRLLAIAKKEKRAQLRKEGKSLQKELIKFRNSADTYTNMTQEQLEREYYEEYMADQFELFKANPKDTKTNSSIKSFFNRIIEWIKAVFESYSKTELQTLFENIDAGKYANATVVANDFTMQAGPAITIANALLPYEAVQVNGSKGRLYLDSNIANNLALTIAANYINRRKDPRFYLNDEGKQKTNEEIIEELLNDFSDLYDPNNPANQKFLATDTPTNQLRYDKLVQIYQAINFDLFADVKNQPIYKAVMDVLDIIDVQKQQQELSEDDYENQDGLRNVTQFGKEAYMNGGFSSLPTYIRSYLATITKEQTDIFGNVELTEGEPLIVPIDVYSVYNGILKSVKSKEDPLEILQAMYLFSQDNPNTKGVVKKMFEDIGIPYGVDVSQMTLPENIKDPLLFNQITKAFTNFRVEWLFQQMDESGNVITYSAAERDDIHTQIDLWGQAYITLSQQWLLDKRKKKEATDSIKAFRAQLLGTETIEDAAMQNLSVSIAQNLFDSTGIKLSPLYIKYSIIRSRGAGSSNQQLLLDFNETSDPVTAEDLYFINDLIVKDVDLYSEYGATSKIRKMAINNAVFDESIGLSVFTNVNGDMVNAHQKPTFNLKRVAALNKISERQKLLNSVFLSSNYLLNNPAFESMANSNLLSIKRISGTKLVETLDRESDYDAFIEGILNTTEYGSYTPKQFITNLINNYTLDFNPKNNKLKSEVTIETESGGTEIVATAPLLIRVLEASNTGDLASLPVIKAVSGKDAAITTEVLNVVYDSIENEYNRIKRENNDETKTLDDIVGYNVGEVQRANTLFNSEAFFLGDNVQVKSQLEMSAMNQDQDISFDQAVKLAGFSKSQFLDKIIRTSLEAKYNRFEALIEQYEINDLINNDLKKGIVLDKKGEARALSIKAAEALNLRADQKYNLRQVFFNDYINTKSLNELLLGDQARILKNSIDKIKRAKGMNAAFDNVYTPLTDEKKGVTSPTTNINVIAFNEPSVVSDFSGQSIDRADAQMYLTPKAFRQFWFGLGKLSQTQADLLNKIERGEKLTSDDVFGPQGLINQNGIFNSKKFVHFDGESFIKMSGFMLSRQLTSNDTGRRDENDNIIWEAKPGKEELHFLLNNMEALEAENNFPSIAAPESAFKMLKQNLVNLKDNIDSPSSIISARDFGLQVVNPSNKKQITELSQIKTLITSEQVDDTPVSIEGMPEIKNIADVKRAYNNAIRKRLYLKFKNKRNLIYTFEGLLSELDLSRQTNKITANLAAFFEYAQNSLKASQSSSNLIEMFSINPETNEPNFDINNPIAIAKAEQLFLSYFNKGVFQEKIPGDSFALVSDLGTKVLRRVYNIEEDGSLGRSEIIREIDSKGITVDSDLTIEGLKGLDIPKEGIVVYDRLRYNVKEYDSNGKETGLVYSEALIPALSKEVYEQVSEKGGVIPDVIAKMFGVRIPSQDKHSAMNIKVVDFLPVYYGSSAVFPAELVEVSGADFDIDKLYTQMKDYYYNSETKTFDAYGETKGREFQDYIAFINKKVNEDTVYAEAVKSFEKQGSKLEDSAETLDLNDLGWSDRSIKAIQRLGLPKTQLEYAKYKEQYGEPYSAPLDNQILDYRTTLLGNEGIRKISTTPAALAAVEAAYQNLKLLAPNYVESRSAENVDVDDIYGKTLSFENNKGAAIGRAVSPNLYLSLLTEYGIQLDPRVQFRLNSKFYKGFDTLEVRDGERKQDVISSIVTMLTDNSKENYVAKLGMHKQAVSIATNMVALGVPLEDAVLLLNTKIARDLFDQAANKKQKFDKGFTSLIKERITLLNKQLKKKGLSDSDVNQDELAASVEGEPLLPEIERDILSILYKVASISQFTGNLEALTGISGNGIGKNLSDIEDKIDKFERLGLRPSAIEVSPLLDITPIIQNSWVNSSLRVFNEIADQLIPTTFITGTDVMNEFYDKLAVSFDTDNLAFNNEVEQSIKRDLLSYFTIKAYKYNVGNTKEKSAGTLTNALIYPGGNFNIYTSVNRLKIADPNNFFLTKFLEVLPIQNKNNNTGLNLLQSNSWRKLNKLQKIDLQTSFAKLYGDPATRADAMTIVNYIMVKDGLQLKRGTLLDAISPFVIDEYLTHINTVKETFLSNTGYEETFGLTKEELYSELEDGYLTSNITGPKLKQVEVYQSNLGTQVRGLRGSLTNDKNAFISKAAQDELNFDFEDQPKYIRVKDMVENVATGFVKTTYLTFKIEPSENASSYRYNLIETMGSNFQNGIGFMFGERSTYNQVKDNIKNKEEIGYGTNEFAGVDDSSLPSEDALQNIQMQNNMSVSARILSNDRADIVADENSVGIIDEGQGAINISDATLSNLLSVTSQVEPTQQTSEVEVVTYKGTKYSVDFNVGSGTITNLKTGKVLEGGVTSPIGQVVVDLAIAQQDSTQQTSEVKVVNKVYYKVGMFTKNDDAYLLSLKYKGRDYDMVISRDGEIIDPSYYNPNTQKDVDVNPSIFNFSSEDIKNIFLEIEQLTQQTSVGNVLEAQASLPEVSEQKAEQLDLFEAELQDRYPTITEFYNSIFALGFVNEEILQNKTSLKENNISSLEDMVSAFEANSFESEEAFVDNIKKCILGK